MNGEAKVKLAADMTSTLFKVTMDSVRRRQPGVSEAKVLKLTRRRIERRPPLRMEEAIPYFASVGKPTLSDLAGKWKMTSRDTEEMLKGLKRFWSRWKKPNHSDSSN